MEQVKWLGRITSSEDKEDIVDKMFSDFSRLKIDKKCELEIDVKLEEDIADPYITGCIVLHDNCIAICDLKNKIVKTIHPNFNLNESLPLKGSPWDIAAIDTGHHHENMSV